MAYRGVDCQELWWQFAWSGDAPRFPRASLAVAVVAGVLAIDALVNHPVDARSKPTPIPDSVRRILARCPTTQPMVALLGDKCFLIDDADTALLAYGTAGRSWITMGDPVGDGEAGRELIWRFAELVDRAGGRPVFFDLSPAFLPDYVDLGLTILKIGEVAKADLHTFSLEGPELRDLRRADRRATRDELEFAVIPPRRRRGEARRAWRRFRGMAGDQARPRERVLARSIRTGLSPRVRLRSDAEGPGNRRFCKPLARR